MDKKIGNIIIIFFLFFSSIILAKNHLKVELKATNHNLNELEAAGIGCPFIIELIIEGNIDFNSTPIIDNLNNYLQRDKGVNCTFNSINGVTKVTKIYQYEVRIDKEGLYKFGPIHLNGKKYDSILNVDVKKNQKLKSISDNISSNVFFELHINKKKVYLNEEIELTIKFLYKDNCVNLIDYEFPILKNFNFDNDKKYFSGEEKINDDTYYVHETKLLMYPNKTGDLLIPSCKAYYEVPVSTNNGIFSFFGAQVDTREIVSNSLKINVKDLPPYKEKIHGVGIFKSFTAKLNQESAMQGEGIVLKLEIEGKANLENIKFEDFDLPANIKFYESKNYIEKQDNGFKKKILEFIIQCNDIGKFKIPGQKFNFFNPVTSTFHTLKTKSLNLEIKPLNKEKEVNKPTSKNEVEVDEIKPIKNEFYEDSTVAITKKWLFIFFIMPLIINLLFFCKSFIVFDNNPTDKALKKLNKAKKKDNPCEIYNIFIQFFIEKNKIATNPIITQEFIKDKLYKAGFSQILINEWEKYFNHLAEITFFKNSSYSEDIFDQAYYWLNIFKKSL